MSGSPQLTREHRYPIQARGKTDQNQPHLATVVGVPKSHDEARAAADPWTAGLAASSRSATGPSPAGDRTTLAASPGSLATRGALGTAELEPRGEQRSSEAIRVTIRVRPLISSLPDVTLPHGSTPSLGICRCVLSCDCAGRPAGTHLSRG
jgi:hypothetical protein